MEELQFQVIVDPLLEVAPSSVVFGDIPLEKNDVLGVSYATPNTALAEFFLDLLLGRPFPLVFATRRVDSLGTLVAMALFLHRELAILPTTPPFVTSVNLYDSLSTSGLAHVDRDLGRFLVLLKAFFPSTLSRKDLMGRLPVAVGWIREYLLNGALPALPPDPVHPRVLDVGSNGFVLAEMPSWDHLEWGWVELYRQGFLRGALVTSPKEDRRQVLVARKSRFLAFDLTAAADILNQAEAAMGEPTEWRAGDLWLESPKRGTLILLSALVQVFIRI